MAQTGYTPLFIYSSTTAAATPTTGNLTNGTLGSELAINITDGKLFYKDNANAIQVIGWKLIPVTAGGTGQTSYTDGQLLIGNTTGNTLTKATLTAGAGIAITNGSGAITIARSGASFSSAPVTATSNYSVTTTDTWIINNKSGSSLTVTLPAASTNTGRELTIQNYQAQTVISASSNVVPQGGGSAGTAILAASVGDSATLVSDGTNWVSMQYASYNNLLIE
jgi:hypothetical protein